MLAANNGVGLGLPVKGLDVQNSGFPSSSLLCLLIFLIFFFEFGSSPLVIERIIDWRLFKEHEEHGIFAMEGNR
jgi:hypothetical protein